jgi:hypothetical protein
MPQRTVQEEQLRQLRQINAQLNPEWAVLKFILLVSAVLFVIFGLFAVFVAIPAQVAAGKDGFFKSSGPPAAHHAQPIR